MLPEGWGSGYFALLKFSGVGRIVRRLAPKLVVFDHGFDDFFLLIGNQLKLHADIEIFRAQILMAPNYPYRQGQTRGVDLRQLRQLDGDGQLLIYLQ
jgi:hypothetical protein